LPFKADLFKPLRMSSDTVIDLPKPAATYRVLTTQNPSGAKAAPLSRLTGKLVINDPKLFWRDSRYLVIVERGCEPGRALLISARPHLIRWPRRKSVPLRRDLLHHFLNGT